MEQQLMNSEADNDTVTLGQDIPHTNYSKMSIQLEPALIDVKPF